MHEHLCGCAGDCGEVSGGRCACKSGQNKDKGKQAMHVRRVKSHDENRPCTSHKGTNGHERGQGDAGGMDEARLRPKQAPSRVCEAELLCITCKIGDHMGIPLGIRAATRTHTHHGFTHRCCPRHDNNEDEGNDNKATTTLLR